MSYLALILGRDGPTRPQPVHQGWPAPLDATHAAIRPASRPLNTIHVGPGGDFPEIGLAIDEAKRIQSRATGGNEKPGPDYRVDILIAPGEYIGSNGITDQISLVGKSGNPADVLLAANDDGAGGTLHMYGAAYMEGITLATISGPDPTDTPKYPVHYTIEGGTVLAVNVRFEDRTTDGDTAAILGADGGSGTDFIFYRCGISATRAHGTNMHGGGGSTEPVTVTWALSDATGENVGFAPLSDQIDVLHWHGGTVDQLGIGAPGILRTSGDPAIGGIEPGTAHEVVESWPIPEQGLSDRWRDYYYPSRVTEQWTLEARWADEAPMTPVVGRVYYVPIPVSAAIHATHAGWRVATPGRWGMTPMHGLSAIALSPSGDPATSEFRYYYERIFYPGEQYAWMAITFSGDARPLGSKQMSADLPCWYSDDGQTLTPVPPGTPHPLAYVRAAGRS